MRVIKQFIKQWLKHEKILMGSKIVVNTTVVTAFFFKGFFDLFLFFVAKPSSGVLFQSLIALFAYNKLTMNITHHINHKTSHLFSFTIRFYPLASFQAEVRFSRVQAAFCQQSENR